MVMLKSTLTLSRSLPCLLESSAMSVTLLNDRNWCVSCTIRTAITDRANQETALPRLEPSSRSTGTFRYMSSPASHEWGRPYPIAMIDSPISYHVRYKTRKKAGRSPSPWSPLFVVLILRLSSSKGFFDRSTKYCNIVKYKYVLIRP